MGIYRPICKHFHTQFGPTYGKKYVAEFDNQQKVIRLNNSLENMKTYEECNCKFDDISQVTFIKITSDENIYHFEMFSGDKENRELMMELQFPSSEIHGA